MGEWGGWGSRRTGPAEEHWILCVFGTQFLHRLVHWDKASVSDWARKDGMDRHVAFSEDEFACAAVDAVRTNDGIRRCGRAVLEMEKYGAAFFFLDGLDTLVEVCAFSRHSFDEFVEEMSAVYASHAAFSLLGADHLAFMLAIALIEKNRISNFQAIYKVLIHGLHKTSLTTTWSAKVSACDSHLFGVACFSKASQAWGPMSLRARWVFTPKATPAPISPKECAAS